MARIRTIKPEFWRDSKTGTLSDRATKLFIGMFNFADDYGVLEYDLVSIKACIFPHIPKSAADVVGKPLLSELLPRGLVILFKYDRDDKAYLLIKNFEKHQVIDRPGKPLIENFDPKKLKEVIDGDLDNSTNTRRTLDEHSTLEGKGKEGKGKDDLRARKDIINDQEYKSVIITMEERDKLIERYGSSTVKLYMRRLNNYIQAKGVKYKSHYHVLLMWMDRDGVKTVPASARPMETPATAHHVSEEERTKVSRMISETVAQMGGGHASSKS